MVQRILIVGGDCYTNRIVLDQARHLHCTGRYRVSVLAFDDGAGLRAPHHPSMPEHVEFWTNSARDAHGWKDWVRTVYALLSAPSSRGTNSAPAPSNGGANHDVLSRLRHRFTDRALRTRRAGQIRRLLPEYDVVQWHTLAPDMLYVWKVFPRDMKVVLSIWGSDLLRTAGTDAYQAQYAACRRATCITTNSIEMREFLLAKFGRDLQPKVRLAPFGSDMIDAIDTARQNRDDWLKQQNIPASAIRVCIGNNGSESNHHLAVLGAVRSLTPQQRQNVVCILPMTYGASRSYLEEVRRTAETTGCDVRILDQHMTRDDVARLRLNTDILVHVPETDAFSASMIESLYAGCVLVTGAWLPYGPLRRAGVHFHEVNERTEVGPVLAGLLDRYRAEGRQENGAAGRLRDLASWNRVIHDWTRIYDELQSESPPEVR